ncbi:unnamed protein product [Pleuronectes platessa]|uniref:Uncharacterized protein n=1 Tax=Pleuronectes platessa TaxID=8262 RepID=A0A9N7U5R2_PLEPL|nr:unnamed protein product [Pleuronectes platessa]
MRWPPHKTPASAVAKVLSVSVVWSLLSASGELYFLVRRHFLRTEDTSLTLSNLHSHILTRVNVSSRWPRVHLLKTATGPQNPGAAPPLLHKELLIWFFKVRWSSTQYPQP